jgi:hypothetical protein
MVRGAPIALGAPKLKGPAGFFPPRYMASPPLEGHIFSNKYAFGICSVTAIIVH